MEQESKGQKLTDLVPHEVEFRISRCSEPLKLRACTLLDDVWALKKFGRYIEEVLTKPQIEEIIQICFRLLVYESQKQFEQIKVPGVDEEGRISQVTIGGAELLMHTLTGGSELEIVSKAVLESVGFSRPVIEDAEKEVLKKKSMTMEVQTQMVGNKSSTSSPMNTVGQASTF